MVGDRERLHSELSGPAAKPVYSRTSVQKTVVSMNVEVDEFAVFFGHSFA